jgi:hypothetical protein
VSTATRRERNAYQDINLPLRPPNRTLDEIFQVSLQHPQLIPQPKPHIRSNLLIPAPACVQLAADLLAQQLAQPSFISSMYVLVIFFLDEYSSSPFLRDLCEALLNGTELSLCEDPGGEVSTSKGNGASDILRPKDLVVRK